MSLNSELAARWQLMAPREKTLVVATVLLVVFAATWWIAIAPALATVRTASAQQALLDAQLQRMQSLQAQAKAMQALPRQSYDEALRLLETSVRQTLGVSARLSIAGERVTVTLSGAQPGALAQWLTQVRVNARALPAEARLNRNAGGLLDGTVVLSLPAR